jgi:uncharacterized protein
MRMTVTGASGLIGSRLLAALCERGDEVTVLSRDPDQAARVWRARSAGADRPSQGPTRASPSFQAWRPTLEPTPARSLTGRDAVVHLAGENVAQRWSERGKQAIRDSRVVGTQNLIRGIRACEPGQRPRALVSASAVGYYGVHSDEPIDEEAPAGSDFLAQTCLLWEQQSLKAQSLGVRVVLMRIGVVLDARGGALGKMLQPFRLGVGGPIAGGQQYMPWVHIQDVVGMALAAATDERWQGPVNVTAPEPATNRKFSRALGRALRRPALLPVPAFALRALYGEMAQIVTSGVRALPAKALVLGYEFHHPNLDEALTAALDR